MKGLIIMIHTYELAIKLTNDRHNAKKFVNQKLYEYFGSKYIFNERYHFNEYGRHDGFPFKIGIQYIKYTMGTSTVIEPYLVIIVNPMRLFYKNEFVELSDTDTALIR
ncbi:hypothetical protein LJB89_03135 [Tyzzerella sp. OttesenSCG-928-J15]|nr:hypothetical protein [Tyzzerella sp. OttesenSCG-928-J15]